MVLMPVTEVQRAPRGRSLAVISIHIDLDFSEPVSVIDGNHLYEVGFQ